MKERYGGVKFYSEHDMAGGFHLRKAAEVLNGFSVDAIYSNINEILELYNIIKKYFDCGAYLAEWDESKLSEYQQKVKKIYNTIGCFFATINNENLEDIVRQVGIDYKGDFWEVFGNCKTYQRIDGYVFSEVLKDESVALWHILPQKEVVKCFGSEIAGYMRSSVNCAELMVHQYLAEHREGAPKYYFPEELTAKDRQTLLTQYIDLESVNPNLLHLIENAQSSPEFPVDNKIRLKAKKRYQSYWDEHFSGSKGVEFGAEISFVEMNDPKKEHYSDFKFKGEYSSSWISENLDYPTLLNNFVYLFDFVDKWFRCSFVSLPSKMGTIEQNVGIKGNRDYIMGACFNLQSMITDLQMSGYTQELRRNGIEVEDIFRWFFSEYLKDEFNAEGFLYNPPSENTTLLEKCKLLASAIDGVLKQFRLFSEDGSIDRELLEISSEHMVIGDLKGMVAKKYAYNSGKEIANEQFLLYSDQSLLNYIDKVGDRYPTFAQLIMHEHLYVSDFAEYQKPGVQWLLNRGALKSLDDGKLSLDMNRAFLNKELFENQVLCVQYCGTLKPLIEELVNDGELVYGESLFSKPEQDYLDYMLNKSRFSNGLDLRNKYIHDSQSLQTEIQAHDYVRLLKIMVLVIVKINEEFCLRERLAASLKTEDL